MVLQNMPVRGGKWMWSHSLTNNSFSLHSRFHWWARCLQLSPQLSVMYRRACIQTFVKLSVRGKKIWKTYFSLQHRYHTWQTNKCCSWKHWIHTHSVCVKFISPLLSVPDGRYILGCSRKWKVLLTEAGHVIPPIQWFLLIWFLDRLCWETTVWSFSPNHPMKVMHYLCVLQLQLSQGNI